MIKIAGLTTLAAIFASGVALADVTFYEGENFTGRQVDANGTHPNLTTSGFNHRARSAVVDGSGVEVCRDINFGGGCTVLKPGRHPSLGEWNNQISSTRAYVAPKAQPVLSDGGGRATFYEAEGFQGRNFSANGAVPNLVERGFNDRAESAIVEGAAIEICRDINFGGGCGVLQPGRYETLGDYRNRVSSIRPVATGPDRRDWPNDGRRASATLYRGPNLTGRPVALTGDGASDLGAFSGRASSLVVENGYWIFCTEPEFRGQCRTFGPGEYRQLPPQLDNTISSGRRISTNYPYAGRPDWDRR